jgi:hypothetical protein
VIRIRGRAVVYGEVWFDEAPPRNPGVDILVYRYRRTPIANSRSSQLHSLRTDLAAPAEAIVSRFEQSCRRQIRCAERNDRLQYRLFPEPAGQLAEFASFYDVFAGQKGLWPADRHWLSRALEAGGLILSCVVRNGEKLVWHAHLRSGQIVQMAHSASWYRSAQSDQRALVARANRWLHWRDMLAFKSAGVRHYDWGGMFPDESTPERAGINRFKRTFRGTPVLAYECSVPVTLRGRVWLGVRGVLRPAPKRAQSRRARPERKN